MADETDTKALEETKARFRKGSEKYAQKSGYNLSPDPEVVDTIVTGLARNKLKHGRGYCPCFFVSGDPAQDKKLICPCEYHHEDIKKHGKCHCGLFVR